MTRRVTSFCCCMLWLEEVMLECRIPKNLVAVSRRPSQKVRQRPFLSKSFTSQMLFHRWWWATYALLTALSPRTPFKQSVPSCPPWPKSRRNSSSCRNEASEIDMPQRAAEKLDPRKTKSGTEKSTYDVDVEAGGTCSLYPHGAVFDEIIVLQFWQRVWMKHEALDEKWLVLFFQRVPTGFFSLWFPTSYHCFTLLPLTSVVFIKDLFNIAADALDAPSRLWLTISLLSYYYVSIWNLQVQEKEIKKWSRGQKSTSLAHRSGQDNILVRSRSLDVSYRHRESNAKKRTNCGRPINMQRTEKDGRISRAWMQIDLTAWQKSKTIWRWNEGSIVDLSSWWHALIGGPSGSSTNFFSAPILSSTGCSPWWPLLLYTPLTLHTKWIHLCCD